MNVVSVHNAGYERRKRWPTLFDLNFWRGSVSYELIKSHCNTTDVILEVGCLTGHHLILLSMDGYKNLSGIDFCFEAIEWAKKNDKLNGVSFTCGTYPGDIPVTINDRIILFDTLEHSHNCGEMLSSIIKNLKIDGELLVLVPVGTMYCDDGHVNFYPDCSSLKNLLQYYFDVCECILVDNNSKIFARCVRKK